jgi:hypothetical protein
MTLHLLLKSSSIQVSADNSWFIFSKALLSLIFATLPSLAYTRPNGPTQSALLHPSLKTFSTSRNLPWLGSWQFFNYFEDLWVIPLVPTAFWSLGTTFRLYPGLNTDIRFLSALISSYDCVLSFVLALSLSNGDFGLTSLATGRAVILSWFDSLTACMLTLNDGCADSDLSWEFCAEEFVKVGMYVWMVL